MPSQELDSYLIPARPTLDFTTSVPPPVSPTFLVDPESVTLVSGEVASFTCTAIGPPPPEITWEDGAGNNVTDNDMFNITQVSDGANVSSILEFVADLEENQTQYRCVAENRVNRTESELATVIIAG